MPKFNLWSYIFSLVPTADFKVSDLHPLYNANFAQLGNSVYKVNKETCPILS